MAVCALQAALSLSVSECLLVSCIPSGTGNRLPTGARSSSLVLLSSRASSSAEIPADSKADLCLSQGSKAVGVDSDMKDANGFLTAW